MSPILLLEVHHILDGEKKAENFFHRRNKKADQQHSMKIQESLNSHQQALHKFTNP
jgi:hypothetical protein